MNGWGWVIDVKLTPKQKAFCDYYIETANATQSYIRAGYRAKNENSAAVEGHKLLRKPNVSAYIKERIAQKEHARIASQDEVLEFLTAVLRGEETEEVPVSMVNKFEMIEKRPGIKERTKAAELLGKRYRLFTDKVDITSDEGIRLVVDYGDDES